MQEVLSKAIDSLKTQPIMLLLLMVVVIFEGLSFYQNVTLEEHVSIFASKTLDACIGLEGQMLEIIGKQQ